MNIKKLILFAIMMLFSVIILISTTLRSQAEDGKKLQQEYYDKQESTYISQIRMVLKQAGYPDAGINLTRISESNGERTYSLMINHRRINQLTDSEQEQLKDKLAKIGIGETNSKILQKFFEEDC